MCLKCFHIKGLSNKSLDSKKKKEIEIKKHLRKRISQFTKTNELLTNWDSIGQAARVLGLCKSHIIKCCKGKLKTYKQFKWKYL